MIRCNIGIIIIIILIVYLINNYKKETFLDNVQFNTSSPCCLVEKEYIYDTNAPNNGRFDYTYKIINDPDKCDYDLYNINNNKNNLFINNDNLFIDTKNNDNIVWSNKMCSNKTSPLGSCRFANKECVDFIVKEECDRLKMDWSEKTCNDNLKFNFIDRIKYNLPEKNFQIIQMFPS
jgi:hypothetical protein